MPPWSFRAIPGVRSVIHHIDDETLRDVLDNRQAALQRLADLETSPEPARDVRNRHGCATAQLAFLTAAMAR